MTERAGWTDDAWDLWHLLKAAASADERETLIALAVRARAFWLCSCGELHAPGVPRCWRCQGRRTIP
jgi:hypothetical protein